MNVFQKLIIEYDGISETIKRYTQKANINNYLNQLNTAIADADYDRLMYCLTQIDEWYEHNMHSIATNNPTYDLDSHIKNAKFIKDVLSKIKREDCVSNTSTQNRQKQKEKTVIFLSHKSDDKKYGDALERFIIGLGVKNDQLIYTSHPLHKIPLDKSIYEYLRSCFDSNVFVIILWSNKYLESPACLNEMGAAWVTQSDYTNIYVPDFSFGNPKYHECAVDTRKMGAVLNGNEHCKASMLELKNKIEALFNLNNREQDVTYLLDQFMRDITEEKRNGQTENAQS